jgi:hypothetical protein
MKALDLTPETTAHAEAEKHIGGGRTISESDRISETPRSRLRSVANGQTPLAVEDVEALLTDYALDADERARDLARTATQLTEFMFSADAPDPVATLGLIKDLSTISRANAEEMRRTIELLVRIRRQPPPRVQVVAVDGSVNVAGQQVNAGAIDLGDRR